MFLIYKQYVLSRMFCKVKLVDVVIVKPDSEHRPLSNNVPCHPIVVTLFFPITLKGHSTSRSPPNLLAQKKS